jgi:hypothetical protein
MKRKQLAADSGLLQRVLAGMEAGKGNASLNTPGLGHKYRE